VGAWSEHASPEAVEVLGFTVFECAYLKESDFLLTWNGETSQISVFPTEEKGLLSGSALESMSCPQQLKAASLS